LPLTWDRTYEVGIEIIDAQHRRLLSCLEALQKKHKAGCGVPSLDVLDFLMSWLGKHTLSEDVTMARYVVSAKASPRLELILGSKGNGK